MTRLPFDRMTWVWLLLILATVCSLEVLGRGAIASVENMSVASTLILVIAFVKVRYVGLEFMELRHAPRALRIGFEGWTAATCAALIGLYLLG